MTFDTVIEAYLAGRAPKLTPLVEFDFPSGPQRLWLGQGTLHSGAKDWLGINRVLTIDGLGQAQTTESADLTFTLSGADDTMFALFPIAAAEDRAGYVGATVIVYLQFLDDDFQTIADPWALCAGICGTMEISNQVVEEEGTFKRRRTIMLPATNIFFGRGVAPNSFWSDRDQQRRFAGDTGLSEIAALQDFTFVQPWR